MPNFRKTTANDVEIAISGGTETEISINVSLHPKDIEKLYDVLFKFLKLECEETNRHLSEFEKEYNEYHVDIYHSITNHTPSV